MSILEIVLRRDRIENNPYQIMACFVGEDVRNKSILSQLRSNYHWTPIKEHAKVVSLPKLF